MISHLTCAMAVAKQYAGGQFDTFVDPKHDDWADVAWAAEVIDGVVVVCLEGSHHPPDWAKDFRFLPLPIVGATVHRGFYQGMPATWQAIKRFIAGRTFVLCGHSLGAARADILTYLAVLDGTPPLAYLRWGEPAPAYGPAFGLALAGVKGTSYRNVKSSPRHANEVDLVTEVPPAIFDARHPQPFTDVYAPPDAEAAKWGLLAYHHFGLYLSVTPETLIQR